MKQFFTLESLKNDFNFVFHMPSGASWGNAIDAAFEILQKLQELSKQSAQAVNPNAAPAEPAEPVAAQGE